MMLKSEHTQLRPLEPDDVELLYQWENDPESWKVSSLRVPLSKFMLAAYIKTANRDIWESRELRLVIENQDGKAIGTVELFDFEPYHSRAGVGIIINDHNEREKGHAEESLKLIINFAKTELGLHQLYANVAASNQPSIRLFEKLGFALAGTKKNWLRIPNGWDDEGLYQLFLVGQ